MAEETPKVPYFGLDGAKNIAVLRSCRQQSLFWKFSWTSDSVVLLAVNECENFPGEASDAADRLDLNVTARMLWFCLFLRSDASRFRLIVI